MSEPQPTPGASEPDAPPGLAVESDELLRAALVSVAEVGDAELPPGSSYTRLLPRGVLVVNAGCPTCPPTCQSRPPVDIAHRTLTCDARRERCGVDDMHTYLFRRGTDGIWLFAIILGPSGDEESPEVAAVLDRRDAICELYGAIRARAVHVDPGGYIRGVVPEPDGQETEEGEEYDFQWEERCGAAAQPAAEADAARLDAPLLTCTETRCFVGWDAPDAFRFVHAHRAGGGLLVVGFVEGPDGQGQYVLQDDVRARQAYACGASGGEFRMDLGL